MEERELSCGVQQYVEKGRAMIAAEKKQRAQMKKKRFDTIAVHGIYGMEAALANQGSIIEPAYLSTAQHFESSDHMEAALAYLMPSWTYSRIANPTTHYLEETLALLEGYGYQGDTSAMVTSSGMSAIFMATQPFLAHATKRTNIVVSARCYGGSFMLFGQRYGEEQGIEVRWVRQPLDLDEWEAKIDADTRFVFGEMPTNPTLDVMDIEGVAQLAHQHEAPLIVDSTVATPALLRPLLLGADIVVHSASKSMTTGGFGIAGAIVSRHNIPSKVGPDALRDNFALYVKLHPYRDYGPGLSPFNALMILNDLRTLRYRMDLISQNCMRVAQFLASHPGVKRVLYPGMDDMPGYELAARTMWLADGEDTYGHPVNRYGHLLSFVVAGSVHDTRKVLDGLEMIWRATDLGRIKSVATIPAISTHQQQGDEGRDLADVPPTLIRLNVGAEHPDDIISDLSQALDSVLLSGRRPVLTKQPLPA